MRKVYFIITALIAIAFLLPLTTGCAQVKEKVQGSATLDWGEAYTVAVEGHIESPFIFDYNTKTYYRDFPASILLGHHKLSGAAERDFPASIPLGHTINGAAGCWNDSPDTIRAKLSAWFVDPDGQSRATYSYTVSIDPSSYMVVPTHRITLDKAGAWFFYVRMEPG